ncbi:hypothetical protein JRO89_XS01G0337400 [Xanthoceras sorbifolium]|uniref:Myb-like domain-containing protein n=1 Tax=Xanthoceras sorbifolium TaxID=99658 RepID=A0ABQ8IMZ8_9ROSI|nr:hypothetical protein JRO89_XS01G0337400 [Xanthoceras sorbifolium]
MEVQVGLHRGPWTPREDTLLTKYIQANGEGHWRSLPKKAEKPKVHLPKPVRVTSFLSLPRNESFEFNNTASTVSLSQGGLGTEVVQLPPPYGFIDDGDQNGTGFLGGVHDDHDDLANVGSDFECQSQVFTGENSLEKLYEEYLQILKNEDDQVQLDSFAESLLI